MKKQKEIKKLTKEEMKHIVGGTTYECFCIGSGEIFEVESTSPSAAEAIAERECGDSQISCS